MNQRCGLGLGFVALLVMLGLLESPACGQSWGAFSRARLGISPYSQSIATRVANRPTVSPYLNLAFQGPGTNQFGAVTPTYQTLVRPQLEARQAIETQARQYQQLQSQVSDLRSALDNQQRQGGFSTGLPTRFNTHFHYFPQLDQR